MSQKKNQEGNKNFETNENKIIITVEIMVCS